MLQIAANLRLSTQNVVKKRFLDEKVIFWRKMFGTIFSKVWPERRRRPPSAGAEQPQNCCYATELYLHNLQYEWLLLLTSFSDGLVFAYSYSSACKPGQLVGYMWHAAERVDSKGWTALIHAYFGWWYIADLRNGDGRTPCRHLIY